MDVLYRALEVKYNGTSHYKGLKVWNYIIPISPQLDNVTVNPTMAQFNQYGPSGVLNLTSCYGNLPIFASYPLFFGAPEYEANNSRYGIPPANAKQNQGYFRVEPDTGVIFDANASMQLFVPVNSLPLNRSRTHLHRNDSNLSLANLQDGMNLPIYGGFFSFVRVRKDRGRQKATVVYWTN